MSSTYIKPRFARRQYFITYSQADASKFPTRELFAEAVVEESNGGKSIVKVQHWACCKEQHENGEIHYHCALKLTGIKKWKENIPKKQNVKENIPKKQNITLHFSDAHDFYISAYRYICKEDTDLANSQNHPDLADAKSPRRKESFTQYRRANIKSRSGSLPDSQKTTKQTKNA